MSPYFACIVPGKLLATNVAFLLAWLARKQFNEWEVIATAALDLYINDFHFAPLLSARSLSSTVPVPITGSAPPSQFTTVVW